MNDDDDDPLASPTLALLYMNQGHLGHARQVLDSILQRDPYHGGARVLRERLTRRGMSSLNVAFVEGVAEIRWQGIPLDGEPFLIVEIFAAGSTDAVVHETPCRRANGSWRIALLVDHGSLTAAVRRSDARRLPLAVANPLSW